MFVVHQLKETVGRGERHGERGEDNFMTESVSGVEPRSQKKNVCRLRQEVKKRLMPTDSRESGLHDHWLSSQLSAGLLAPLSRQLGIWWRSLLIPLISIGR